MGCLLRVSLQPQFRVLWANPWPSVKIASMYFTSKIIYQHINTCRLSPQRGCHGQTIFHGFSCDCSDLSGTDHRPTNAVLAKTARGFWWLVGPTGAGCRPDARVGIVGFGRNGTRINLNGNRRPVSPPLACFRSVIWERPNQCSVQSTTPYARCLPTGLVPVRNSQSI